MAGREKRFRSAREVKTSVEAITGQTTFRQQGKLQAVHLRLAGSGAATGSQINDGVGRWFERVRLAVAQCTGKIPHASDTPSVSVSAEPAWNRKTLPLILGCIKGWPVEH